MWILTQQSFKVVELPPNSIDFAGGSGRQGGVGACAPADGAPDGTDSWSPNNACATGSRGVGTSSRSQLTAGHVKNKQWTRRVDGLTRREDIDTTLQLSNWLKFSVKKQCGADDSASDLVEEEPADMGNLQGGESKKHKDAGKSPIKEKKRGFLSKKPQPAKAPPVQIPSVAVQVPSAGGASGSGNALGPPEAQAAAHQHNGTRTVDEEGPSAPGMAETGPRLFATDSWRAVNLAASRESSSESIFMDPLTSPRQAEVPEVEEQAVLDADTSSSVSLAPAPSSLTSIIQEADDTSSLDDVTLMEEEADECGSIGFCRLDDPLSEALTEPVHATQRPTSFTLNKHRKVELGSLTGMLHFKHDNVSH